MASTDYLDDLGGTVKPGDSIFDALPSRRINALTEGVRSLTRGDNLTSGPGILIKKSPTGGAVISVVQMARGGSTQPRMVALEIALDADTAPTSAQIDAALLAFYSDDTLPREGDTFRISRADNHYPELEVRLTTEVLGPDWKWSPNTAVVIAEKSWFKIHRDISGRVYFEGAGSKATVNEGGVTVLNKSNSKTLTVSPASLSADMTVRDLQVIVGSEVKVARVIASAPVSQDPPVTFPAAQEYLEGGGIRFLDSDTDAKYITAYLPEIALDDDHTASTLMKLDYVPATLPGGGEGVRLKFSSRIKDKTDSKVRLNTEDSGATWYFDLDSATKTLLTNLSSRLTSLEEYVEIIDETQDDMLATMGEMATAVDALQSDVVTMDTRIDLTNERIDTVNETLDTVFDLLIDHGATLDDLLADVDILDSTQDDMLATMGAMATAVDAHQTAISGATISCNSSGVTLTWGTPPPPPGP